MFNVVIIGAGGCARDVYQWAMDSLSDKDYHIKGFISNNPHDLDNYHYDVPLLGNDRDYEVAENDRFLMAIGDIDIKKRVVEYFKKKGARFLTLVHKTAIVAPTASLGEGVIVCPYALISNNVVVDDFVLVNYYSSFGHDSRIGKYCFISPYATTNGFVVLEDEVFLGTHASVIAYKKVCYRSKISANSVAMNDVPPYSFVYGVPGVHRTFLEKWNKKATHE